MFDIPQHTFYMMMAVFFLLITSTLIRLILKAKYPDKDHTELRHRIQSWWIMISLLFFMLIASKGVAIAFFGFLSFLALKEFLSIVPTRHADRRAIFWVYVSIPIQYCWVAMEWYGMFVVFVPVYLFILIPTRMVLIGETKGFIRAVGILHWASMLTIFGISHIAYLLVLPVQNEAAGYLGPVVFLLLMTQLNDVSQYTCGKLLGRHKIIPRVSPNKTWEGFLGGLIATMVCGGVAGPYLTPLDLPQGVFVGMLIACSGFIGDVVLSAVKRDLHIKDSGHLIPGHGGILDRLDSLTFTSPLFFHYFYYICY